MKVETGGKRGEVKREEVRESSTFEKFSAVQQGGSRSTFPSRLVASQSLKLEPFTQV